MAKVEKVETEEKSEKEDEKREIEFHYAEGKIFQNFSWKPLFVLFWYSYDSK